MTKGFSSVMEGEKSRTLQIGTLCQWKMLGRCPQCVTSSLCKHRGSRFTAETSHVDTPGGYKWVSDVCLHGTVARATRSGSVHSVLVKRSYVHSERNGPEYRHKDRLLAPLLHRLETICKLFYRKGEAEIKIKYKWQRYHTRDGWVNKQMTPPVPSHW